MKKISQDQLYQIYGGAVSASFITALVRAVDGILDLGRSLGTAIRRIYNGRVCSL